MAFQHILVTTDLSADARRAYPLALALAKAAGARLTLLHVVEIARSVPHAAPFAPPLAAPSSEALVEDAERALQAELGQLDGITREAAVVVAGETGAAIAQQAQQRGCDLIVLSTHGHSGLRRLVLGSVAESTMRHAKVPVLAVPPAG
jgi:nucleotide-binding universal stress UspA family protein